MQTVQPEDNAIPKKEQVNELFSNVGSVDFLNFEFGSRTYIQQIEESIQNTGKFCAIQVELKKILDFEVVWMTHDFQFMGGSLGCAEGEKLTKGFEFAMAHSMPVVVESRSGGARMQEGTLALMQLAKVTVAVEALKRRKIPFISVCKDPTYGGVSASYAMQGDVRIAVSGARIGFAGPTVILNTVYKMDQTLYDAECPRGFQTAEFLQKHGQLDVILTDESEIIPMVEKILHVLWQNRKDSLFDSDNDSSGSEEGSDKNDKKDDLFSYFELTYEKNDCYDYTVSRAIDRYQAPDIIEKIFSSFIELQGDGKVGYDPCIRGGLAMFNDQPCVIIATFKGPDANFGMASPAGYRMALRLMNLAQQFDLPVFTLVDTVGAYPSFDSEQSGQSEAIATNLLKMAGLRVPIITLVVSEGGSGGALAIAMGDHIAMLERAYYTVISPEGAASILGRYKNEDHKSEQFSKDCAKLAKSQKIYCHDLKELGVVDLIIPEPAGSNKLDCESVMENIKKFYSLSLSSLSKRRPEELIEQRYKKFSHMGKFMYVSEETIKKVKSTPRINRPRPTARRESSAKPPSKMLKFIADRTLNSEYSVYLGKQPAGVITPVFPPIPPFQIHKEPNAKQILDKFGPDAVVEWIKKQTQVLITDTTMRDAHQSLLATRVRTYDILGAAEATSRILHKAFSLEVWGGATFDVSYRFLRECPWQRLRELRKRVPNILLQMLIRGSNAVGYKSYPDNVIEEFVRLAALNGIDVFRIFDCFNDVEQMRLCINTVKKYGKIAEVCICFTGDFLSPNEKIYTLEYYTNLAKQITESGAHIIGIKDMAGLLKPQMAEKFVKAIRSVSNLPLHFHCHNTSSASGSTVLFMTIAGCDIVDLAIASMADTTSQPSLNSFLAAMEGHERDPGIPYLALEKLDMYWSQVRTIYQPFESGLKCGTARVYDHQIPGGQYSNLLAQCNSLGIMDKWDAVLDMYRDVNKLFGDIIKVTPSSKCIGDMALFLIRSGKTCLDVKERGETIEFPDSVVALFSGELGYPHHGLPKDIQQKVLKGKEPLTMRPGLLLKPVDFAEEKQRLEETWKGMTIGDEEVISSILYPQVFKDFMKWQQDFGCKVFYLSSEVFFSGMRIGQQISVDLPESKESDNFISHSVKLTRVGPLRPDGARVLEFQLDGESRTAKVKDSSVELSGLKIKKADLSDPTHIPSPLPGFVEVIFVGVGSEVKKSEPLFVVSAMKMQVQVVAPFDGIIDSFLVKVGDRVDVGSLLAIVVPKKGAQITS